MRTKARRIFVIGFAVSAFLGIIFIFAAGIFKSPKTFDFSNLEFSPPEARNGRLAEARNAAPEPKNADIDPQPPLADPPAEIKAIYSTGWSAGNQNRLSNFIKLIKETELNAIVIDIKDFSGYVLYDTKLEEPRRYDAVEARVPKINQTLKQLHDEGIYAIARLSVFQDPRLALARADLAMMSSSTGETWKDRKKLSWIDPAAKESWEYNAAIAKEALERGFDEINFDYIRFASDGNLTDIKYPFWDGKTAKNEVLKDFFSYLRGEMREARLSADLFGLVTVDQHDMGIGQHLEDAIPYFDYIAPMVYPSHYFSGFQNYQKPKKEVLNI